MVTNIQSGSSSGLSWCSRLSRTNVSSVAGFSFSGSPVAAAAGDLQSLLRVVRGLKVEQILFDRLEEVQPIGRGETFTVSECRLSERVVAVKHVNIGNDAEKPDSRLLRRRIRSVLREVSIMRHDPLASHPNIVKLLGFGWKMLGGSPFPYIVVEYGEYGSLRSYLATTTRWHLKDKLVHAGDVASGLMALHQVGIIHGDLKLDNVIVFYAWGRPSGGIAKLCDFGHSLLPSSQDPQKYYGTPL